MIEMEGMRFLKPLSECNSEIDGKCFSIWNEERPNVIEMVSERGIHKRAINIYDQEYLPNHFSGFYHKEL